MKPLFKRCGGCAELKAPFGVNNHARSCGKGHTMTDNDLRYGKWYDTEQNISDEEIERAKSACSDFWIPKYL